MKPKAQTSQQSSDTYLTTLVEGLLRTEEAAELLAISSRCLAEHIAAGNLTVIRIGRAVRIHPDALRVFVEAREARGRPLRRRSAKPSAAQPLKTGTES